MNKKVLVIIGVVVLAIGGIGYYFYTNSKILQVIAVKPENNIVEKTVSASGKVISDNDAMLSFAATGKIVSIPVEEGDFVKKGQLLATLNTDATRNSAQALKDARDSIIRERDLFVKRYADEKDDVGGEKEYDLQLRQLNEQVSQADSNYKAQAATFKNYYIYAPFEGTIVNLYKNDGETAALGETILEIADLTKLKFQAEVDQEDFGNLKLGQLARISFDAYEDVEVEAEVSSLPEFVSKESTSTFFKVDAKVTNSKDKNILLGMEGDIEIVVTSTNQSVQTLVFDEVFKENDGRYFVWVLNSESKLAKSYIDIGLEGDLYTEIKTNLSGLSIVAPSTTTQKFEENLPAKVIVR